MKNVIFIAPPAAGKGTLSEYLERKYGYIHISTGELFREKIKKQDEEGKELEQIINSGQLIDDERTMNLLKQKVASLEPHQKFILDGVPRTLQQAHILDIILSDLGDSNYVAINIDVKESVLLKRIIGRRVCSKCNSTYNIYFEEFKPKKENICNQCGSSLKERTEDNEESFKVRYEIFKTNNEPIINYYKEQNRFERLDNTNNDQTETLKALERIVGATID